MVLEMDQTLPIEDRNLLSQLYEDKAVGFRSEFFSLSLSGDKGRQTAA